MHCFSGNHFDPVQDKVCVAKLVDFEDDYFLLAYDDGDSETMQEEELLPFLSHECDRKLLRKHLLQYHTVLDETKQPETDEFILNIQDEIEFPAEFFGKNSLARRRLCWETHNLCIFKHKLSECKCNLGVDVYRKSDDDWDCIFRHDPAVCKCDKEVRMWSQDEATFHAYILGL